jgi:hypothetical protein
MTDRRGRIPALWGEVLVMGALATLAIAGCNDPPPDAPPPPIGIGPSPAIGGGLDDEPVEPGIGRPDYWSETYGAYMSPELKREYLLTPEDERFERFGLRILDFELREQFLLAHQDELTREEKDAYRRLPDADACRRFVRARAGGDTARVSSTTRR